MSSMSICATADDGDSYNLIGEGTLPVAEMMRALYSINYDGFISLEWKPEWMPDLTGPRGHLPPLRQLHEPFRQSSRGPEKRPSTTASAHTGKYVWKKDELIDCTFPQVLDRMVEEFPDQYAFKYTTLDYTRTYAEFRDDVDNFARALISLGVKGRQHVAIWATNVPAVVHHLLGGDQDRRGARDGQHRLQDPRGRVPAVASPTRTRS
jgi:fatty-acyl-CoA synthase